METWIWIAVALVVALVAVRMLIEVAIAFAPIVALFTRSGKTGPQNRSLTSGVNDESLTVTKARQTLTEAGINPYKRC